MTKVEASKAALKRNAKARECARLAAEASRRYAMWQLWEKINAECVPWEPGQFVPIDRPISKPDKFAIACIATISGFALVSLVGVQFLMVSQ